MVEIIQKDLSYKLLGILFHVHSELGNRYQEKYYQRAIEESLKENKLKFQKELCVDLMFNNKKIGVYFLDFLIEDKIVLEVKATPKFLPKDFKQVLAYLTAHNIQLGILANFGTESLTYNRILNSQFRINSH